MVCFVMQACYSPEEGSSSIIGQWTGMERARGFDIESFENYTILHVRDPWQGSSGVHLRYALASAQELLPDTLRDIPYIKTPVSRVICMSTTHVAMIEALGLTGTVIGVSGPDYITNPGLRKRIESGEVVDVGADQALNYERIISLKPDVIISYGVTAEISGMVNRLGDLGIPVILNGDYLENDPLGKTEWIKFMGAFYEKKEESDSVFQSIAMEYERYEKLVEDVSNRPTVLTGLPWKDAWYIPGGKSFAAAFFRDAGGTYLWEDEKSHEAAPVDLEAVFARAAGADFWINAGSALSLDDIRSTEARLAKFAPYIEKKVFNNSGRLNPTGGNDFWETGVMEPHLILADLISIIHPALLPGHKLHYYEKLH